MNIQSRHISPHGYRRLIAVVLTAVYLAFVFTPLVSSALYLTIAAPTAIHECAGDCDLCGCSPESRASHSCCCAKKRQHLAQAHDDDGDEPAGCCGKKKPVEKKTTLACGFPCGNGKQPPLSIGGTSEVIPCHSTEQCNLQPTETRFPILEQRPTSRRGEPPDPPPKLSLLS